MKSRSAGPVDVDPDAERPRDRQVVDGGEVIDLSRVGLQLVDCILEGQLRLGDVALDDLNAVFPIRVPVSDPAGPVFSDRENAIARGK